MHPIKAAIRHNNTLIIILNIHQDKLVDALKLADLVYIYIPKDLDWNSEALINGLDNCYCFRDTQEYSIVILNKIKF